MTFATRIAAMCLVSYPVSGVAEGRVGGAVEQINVDVGDLHLECSSPARPGQSFQIHHAPGAFMANLVIDGAVQQAFVATGGGRTSFVAVVGNSAYNIALDVEALDYFGSKTGPGAFNEKGMCKHS